MNINCGGATDVAGSGGLINEAAGLTITAGYPSTGSLILLI